MKSKQNGAADIGSQGRDTWPEVGLKDGNFASPDTLGRDWDLHWEGSSGCDGVRHGWCKESHTQDGTGSLFLENRKGGSSCSYRGQNIYLVADARYKISVWIKGEDIEIDSVNPNCGPYLSFGDALGLLLGPAAVGGSYGWTHFETYYTATQTGFHTLFCRMWGAFGKAYFDEIDIRLTDMVDPEALAHWTDEVRFPFDDGGFTLAAVGDTQDLAASFPDRFTALYRDLAEKKTAYDIRYVLDMGDVIDSAIDGEQWENAERAHKILRDAGMKYAISPGNHDYDGLISLRDTDMVPRKTVTFNHHFPFAEYDAWLGNENFGRFRDSMDNTWHTFEAGGKKWLIIALEYGPSDEVLDWANGLCAAAPDAAIVFMTHCYVNADAAYDDDCKVHLRDANGGREMWEKCFKRWKNVKMVLGGHFIGYGLSTSVVYGDHGNPVVQMRIDPQGVLGGEPLYALLRITDGKLACFYYSPKREKYYAGANFSLELPQGTETDSGARILVEVGRSVSLLGFTPLDGVRVRATYTTSDPETLAVDPQTGLFTGKKPGTADVFITVDSHHSAFVDKGCITTLHAAVEVK